MVSAGRRPRSSQKAMNRIRSRSFWEHPGCRRGSTSGIRPAQAGERAPPGEGVVGVKLDGQLAADFLRLLKQRVEMARPVEWDHPARMEQEDELAELLVVLGQGLGVKTLKGLLVRSLVIEPGLADVRDDDPVAAQVDGVVKRLVDRRDFPAGERAVERVFRPFALDRRDISLSFRTELTEDRIGEFAVGLDVLLARDRVALGVVDRPGVTEQFAEDVVDEVAEDLLFLVGVDGPGGDDLGPFFELRAASGRRVRAG